MHFTRYRVAALLGSALALVGVWIFLADENANLGIQWLLFSNAAVGAVLSLRALVPSDEVTTRGLKSRSMLMDVVWAGALQLVGSVVIVAVLLVNGSNDSSLIWMPLVGVLLNAMGLGVGLVAGLCFLLPLVLLIQVLFGRRGIGRKRLRIIYLSLLSIVGVGFLIAAFASVSFDGDHRGSLPWVLALVVGIDTDLTAVRSAAGLWAARALGLLTVTLLPLLILNERAIAAERPSRVQA